MRRVPHWENVEFLPGKVIAGWEAKKKELSEDLILKSNVTAEYKLPRQHCAQCFPVSQQGWCTGHEVPAPPYTTPDSDTTEPHSALRFLQLTS